VCCAQHWTCTGCTQKAGAQQVHTGQLPATMCAEGLLLQYIVDARLDEMVETMYQEVMRPPVPEQPLALMASIASTFAFKMQSHNESVGVATIKICNDLTIVGPCGSFIHRGTSLWVFCMVDIHHESNGMDHTCLCMQLAKHVRPLTAEENHQASRSMAPI
jgi:hypothetical protein